MLKIFWVVPGLMVIDVKDGWKLIQWSEVLEIRSGRNQKEVLNPDGKYPIIGSAGKIMNYANKYICDEGTTIIGRKGTINNPQQLNFKFWNVDTAFGLHALESLNKKFLFYFCLSFDFISLDKGSGRPSLVKSDLLKIQIPLPPLSVQKQIVAILDKAFAAIDKAKANAEQNLINAKELFESYLQNVFENKGEDWEETSIKDFTHLITKGSSPKWQGVNYVEEGGIFFLTSKNVGEGELILHNKKHVEEKFNEIQKTSILQKGDVLTNIVGASIGRTAIFDLEETTNINQAVCLMRCDTEKVYNYYLMYLLNSPFFKNILHDNEVDNARANLSLTFFKNLVIPVPQITEQKEIVENIKSFLAQTKKLESIYQQKTDGLNELKKSLLQKAFRGEL